MAAHVEEVLLEVDSVALAVDTVNGADLALDSLVTLDDDDLVAWGQVPERDAVLHAHEGLGRAEVGGHRHRKLAALDRRRPQVGERALHRARQVS